MLTISYANSVDPDEMAHNEPSDWYLHCLHSVFDARLKTLFASVDMPKFQDGRVHSRNTGMKRLILVL